MLPSKPQYDILVSRKAVNLFLAGQGSGKTYCAGAISANFISNFPEVRGLIAANTYDQLNRSTMFRIREVWKHEFCICEWDDKKGTGCYVVGIIPPKHFNTESHNFDSYNNIISFDNGMVIYIGSLDNYKSLDGMEVGWAILDETKDTKEEAVKEVIIGRIRQQGLFVNENGELVNTPDALTPFNPLYIFSSPAKVRWINEWFNLDQYENEIVTKIYSKTDYFRKSFSNKFVTISSTYHNQANLPSNFIDNQKENLHSGLQDMLIYGNPFSKSGGEFYKCFSREKNVCKAKYNPLLALHTTWDFNVHPYVTCNIHQIEGKKVTQIDEICLSSPNNRIADVCREIIRRYSGHAAGLFLYGEIPKEDTKHEKGYNEYVLIREMLAQFRPTMRIANVHPSVVMRGNFINTVFEKGFQGLEFLIGDTCTNTVADYTYLKEASDGTKLKEKVKDKDTLITYEKYGHTSDANDYFYCYAFQNEFVSYQKGSKTTIPITGKNVSKHSY